MIVSIAVMIKVLMVAYLVNEITRFVRIYDVLDSNENLIMSKKRRNTFK